MATKTISIDMKAYEKLRRARRERGESFSKVIHRAHWDEPVHRGEKFLQVMSKCRLPDESLLSRLDAAQDQDNPPEDKWNRR